MSKARKKSGLAKGWTPEDVEELAEIVSELEAIRKRESELHARFAKLQRKVEQASKGARLAA